MTTPRSAPARNGSSRHRYATHEEQLRELLGQLRERDGRVREALVVVLTSATPRLLAAVGTLLSFVSSQAQERRRQRQGA